MSNMKIIYHGSRNIIEKPTWGLGRKNNDFGFGFYCTEYEELAKEWATIDSSNGYSNKYSIDVEYCNILNLNSSRYTILNWIAVLLENRIFSIKTPIANRAKYFLIENFGVNVNAYDIIIGYRADDSYFDFAEAFINNSISVRQLSKAMRLGELGEQVVIKSKYAFSLLQYEGFSFAEKEIYSAKYKERLSNANHQYMEVATEDNNDLFIRDIIREKVDNNDLRIPRNISK